MLPSSLLSASTSMVAPTAVKAAEAADDNIYRLSALIFVVAEPSEQINGWSYKYQILSQRFYLQKIRAVPSAPLAAGPGRIPIPIPVREALRRRDTGRMNKNSSDLEVKSRQAASLSLRVTASCFVGTYRYIHTIVWYVLE